VLKIDPKTGKVLKKIARDRLVTGVSFVDGEVWHASLSGKADEPAPMLHRLDPSSLEERERYPLPETMIVSGLEIDPDQHAFWAGGGSSASIRLITRPKTKARG
jgi:hypothetical protein